MQFVLLLLLVGLARTENVRMNCHPEPSATKQKCEQRGCIWDPKNSPVGIPPCYFKEGVGYKQGYSNADTITLYKNSGPKNPWGDDIPQINFTSKRIGKTLNIRIYAYGRYEPPLQLPANPSSSDEDLMLSTQSMDDLFSFKVIRKSTQTSLFDTSLGGLIFSDKFIQLAAILPSDKMYGWGENIHQRLKHNFERYTTWAMLARDEFPLSHGLHTNNLYGVHPFYMVLEPDGKAHGVFILNSNAQEVTTAPGPALIYRTIGGILDLYFFPGPTPEEVTQQYLSLIGKPFLPAYWALGFQLSRYGYKDLEDMKEKVGRNVKAGIPLDTIVADIDYMDKNKDFTIGEKWKKLPDFIDELHSKGMKAITIYDNAIQVDYEPFERAVNMTAKFIEWERTDQVPHDVQDLYPLTKNTKIMLGVVWPENHVAFPDFFDNITARWWTNEISKDFDKLHFDSIWIDMNEPANLGTNEEHPSYFDDPKRKNLTSLKCPVVDGGKDAEWDMPPYKTHSVWVYPEKDKPYLTTKTLCMLAVQDDGKQRFYNVKNLYGWSEAKVTQRALFEVKKKRGVIISRSTFASSGRYTGHWLGDNNATWDDLRTAVIGSQEFNMFGIPYIGSDICGFFGEPSEELCLRWQQMGAFHTFMRNHNALDPAPQDPAKWPAVAAATRKANLFRYSYLPYLFSLFFEASLRGGTVIRPVFYEYPKDTRTHDLGYEFLWGSSMLITPVLDEGAKSVDAYLPRDDWYSLYDYEYGQLFGQGVKSFPAPTTFLIPVFVRGGSILPRQEPNVTTDYTRQNPFKLLIAPGAKIRAEGYASGFLYWDDGESVVEDFSSHNYYHWVFDFTATKEDAELIIQMDHKAEGLPISTLDVIEIFNYEYIPDFNSFKIDNKKVEIDSGTSYYNKTANILYISKKNFIDMSKEEVVTLYWENEYVGEGIRMDCHPEPSATIEECMRRNCVWDDAGMKLGVPFCYLKRRYIGYKKNYEKDGVITLIKNDGPKNPWGDDIEQVNFTSRYIGKTLNIKIGVEGRYEPPLDLPLDASSSSDELILTTKTVDDVFQFVVARKSTGLKLFDTSLGGLMFSDKFVQIATTLPSDVMYGWGQNVHTTLKHDFTRYTKWAMLARDEPSTADGHTKNLYGVHPFYMMLEPDGNAHGVFILNSNAQEITTTPGPALVYRTIGGNLDLYFFPGPTPEEVTQQYLALIGKPTLPAYWAFGYQLSRYGYKDLSDMKEKISRNVKLGIPLDTVVADIDYMDRYKDFTTGKKWSGLAEYVKELHEQGMKAIFIIDAGVQADSDSFERGLNAGAQFIEWERYDQVPHYIQDLYPLAKNTKIMLAVVWPDGHVAYPDFLDPTNHTANWWIDEFVRYRKEVPYDGIWIDMNEPAAFGTNENHPWYFDSADHPNISSLKCPVGKSDKDGEWDMPPYKTHAVWVYGKESYLSSKTTCMCAVQGNGTLRHYNVKNLYGWSKSRVTQQAQYRATGKRGVVITRSTFPSSGRFTGSWLGDNSAIWDDLRAAIIGAQEFNIFGIPYIGSDICGFNGETTEELCLRWQQMGAFHSFMRNHNTPSPSPQDPAQWDSVANATKKANLFRYRYLPYLYSLHFTASFYGGTVVRPVFYEYPADRRTYTLSHQFLWGKSMLIAPVVDEGATSVKAYLPADDWYSVFDYEYGQLIPHGNQTFPAPWTSLIPVLIRGGSIIPRQKPSVTTETSRKNEFELLVAPGAHINRKGHAKGSLYWDDGESIIESFSTHNYYYWEFAYASTEQASSLSIKMTHEAEKLDIPTLDVLEILNYNNTANFDSFKLNGKKIDIDQKGSYYDDYSRILYITKKHFIDLSAFTSVELTWENVKEIGSGSSACQAWLPLIICAIFIARFL